MNRITIGELACNAGSAECRNSASEKLSSIMNNNGKIFMEYVHKGEICIIIIALKNLLII